MKKILMLMAAFLFISLAFAVEMGDKLSVSPGAGDFWAIRHNKPGGVHIIEIVASPIALQRAQNQAKKGGYELEIEGPFAWHTQAAAFIRKEWNHNYGIYRHKRVVPGGR